MRLLRKKFTTLAIIGNGFDLNHGYKTDYKSFVEHSNEPCLKKFKNICEANTENTWYNFEENISDISRKYFIDSFEKCDVDNRPKILELANNFQEVQKALIKYLRRETPRFQVSKNPNIAKYLTKNTVALNFNYTAIAEAYTKNVIYVHGSLKENDIVLGYDYRETTCLEQYDNMRWSKVICREYLAFCRFLKNKKHFKPGTAIYKDIISGYEEYCRAENSPRGADYNDLKKIPNHKIIKEFLEKNRKSLAIPHIDYKKIKVVLVLGHGIKADRQFLECILERCLNLEKVIIYRYNGESDTSYNEKVMFLKQFCDNIVQQDY